MRFLLADRPFIIAEAGVNHDGRLDSALKLVDIAVTAGADAVKFQTFKAKSLATANARQARYQERAGKSSQQDMLRKLELPLEDYAALVHHCRKRRIRFMSTPFDEKSADFLARFDMSIYKIPSGEVSNHPLLAHIGRIGKPVILSTGMSTLAEVREAVGVLKKAGALSIAVLHCVSNYPTDPRDCNLRAMETMEKALNLPVGYSDHTLGTEAAIAATALGARIIEKHFTLGKHLPGPDHSMSLDPGELTGFIRAIRTTAAALGDGVKRPRPCEAPIARIARKSLVFAEDLAEGTRLTREMLIAKRPGTGISPARLSTVLGKRLKIRARADTLLMERMLT